MSWKISVFWSLALLIPAGLMIAAATAPVTGAVDLLPAAGEFPGWVLTAPAKVYDAEGMWEPINGAADQYLQYDCRALTMAYLKHNGAADEIAVEIYEMPDALHSFGVYAARKPPGEPVVKIGGQGYLEPGNLSFFTDKFFVRLMAQPADETMTDALKKLGTLMGAKPAVPGDVPEIFSRFPKAGQVANSAGFTAKNVWGIRDLNRAFSVEYQQTEKNATVYLITEASDDAAVASLALIRKNMTRRKITDLKEIKADDTTGFSGTLKYKGAVLCLTRGSRLAIVTGVADPGQARELAESLL